jgi:hypothetical protein
MFEYDAWQACLRAGAALYRATDPGMFGESRDMLAKSPARSLLRIWP